jgi:tetratricopeptide (TPR) repeat protein
LSAAIAFNPQQSIAAKLRAERRGRDHAPAALRFSTLGAACCRTSLYERIKAFVLCRVVRRGSWRLKPPMMKVAISGILLALGSALVPRAESQEAHAENPTLQQLYDSAMRAQQAGKLDQAEIQYRAFLANAQAELATLKAGMAGDYPAAAALFEAALALEPESVDIRLKYAQVALSMADFPRAESLAQAVVNDPHGDSHELAEAHQIAGRALLKQNQDQDAKKEMKEAVKLDPNFPNVYGLGVVCLDLDDEKCAGEVFDEIVRSFGDTPAIHMQIGLAYGNSDFVPQAIAEFRKVIAEDPKFPSAHYSLAAALLAAGDDARNLPEAESELKTELAISPNDYLTYAALGKLAVAAQQYDQAETYLKRATALNPANPDAFLYLGQMYFNTNRPQEAEAALRKAIALTKDPSRNRFQIQKAHYMLGRILTQQHRADEAHAEMEIAKAFADQGLLHDKSELAGMLSNSSVTGSVSRTEQSEDHVFKSAKDSSNEDINSVSAFEKRMTPVIADSYDNLGTMLAINKEYDDALIDFEDAYKWSPKLDGLDLNWGRAAFMASRFDQAIGPLSRYIAAHPSDSGVRVPLAISQFMAGDYAGCVATAKAMTGNFDDIPQMGYVFAESLVQTGEIAEGQRRLESLASAHPEIEDVHRSLGEAYESERDLLKAARELRTAIVLNASDPAAHYDLGKVFIESGDAVAAIAELEASVKLKPDDPTFHRQLAIAYRMASRTDDATREIAIYDQLKSPPAGGNKSAPAGDSNSTK